MQGCLPRYLHLIQSRTHVRKGWMLARGRGANAVFAEPARYERSTVRTRPTPRRDKEACKRIPRVSSVRSIPAFEALLFGFFLPPHVSPRASSHLSRAERLFSLPRLVHSIPANPLLVSSSLTGDKRRLNTSRISARCRSRSRNARKRSRATGEKLDRSWYPWLRTYTRIYTHIHISASRSVCSYPH